MSVGFTGTRKGLTQKQKKQLSIMLDSLHQSTYHHGDCIGADQEFHHMIKDKFYFAHIIIHPPKESKYRANCHLDDSDVVEEPRDYLKRNQDIVDKSDILIACPEQMRNTIRSGTWATIRYAIKKQKPIIIMFPDGTIKNGDRFIGYKFTS